MDSPPSFSKSAIQLHQVAARFCAGVHEFDEHFVKESHVLIAIQRHDWQDEQWTAQEAKDRFLWVKGRAKVKFSLVRDSYFNSYSWTSATSPVVLELDGSILPEETKVGELDYFNDRLIVLQAVMKSNLQLPGPNLALNDVDTVEQPQADAVSDVHVRTPSRQPLQPVNRQLTVPPRSSSEDQNTQKSKASSLDTGNLVKREGNENQGANTDQLTTPKAVQRDDDDDYGSGHALSASQTADSQEYVTPKIENPFIAQDEEPEALMRGQPLRELSQATTAERLEAGVKAGADALDNLKIPFEHLKDNPDVQNWIDQIESVRKEAVKTRTVVGVVGNTGAGKSSVINAMLDEERLVPTNCMRACTAVVTELSYDYSSSESCRYRAEVVFIQPEDWRKELKILFEEAFDETGHLSREAQNPDSQAGIAYAKMRAVYHRHTKEMLASATIESLMRVKNIKNILGTTKRINESQHGIFYRKLQHFVDSKEKGTEKLDKNGNKITNPKREFEHWPLIKVVKIYTKADALSNNSIIVDLPGVHDSNAARAAVAEGYIKQCTGLWIVAPINRAVDDKAAKTLLGNTFKRQLKYDGTYSAVTFICSKTDDISRTEAAESLGLGSEMEEIESKLIDLERRQKDLTSQLSRAKASKQDHSDALEDIDDQLEKWEDLQAKIEEGETVYAPHTGTKKRKRQSLSPVSRKKRHRNANMDSDRDDGDLEIISNDAESDGAQISQDDPLTESQVEEKVGELKKLKRDARRERGRIEERIHELRDSITKVENEEADLDARQSELCIAGRNEYSRNAIRLDFAAGIKELDQENAEEEDPDNFNPDEDIRDYEEVARSLPVFCVSSRAYQKLSGRMQKDSGVPGFTTKQQTEMPQLQAHCKKLTEQGRQATCRRFLNSLTQLLNSLGLWASDDGSGIKLTSQQRDTERSFLVRQLKELEKALEKAVIRTLDDVTEHLSDEIFEKFQPAVESAAGEALPTASQWSAHRNDGGLHYMTYKATVRRQGVYQGASGLRDFNAQLTEPITKQLATSWEKSFQRRLPHILQTFPRSVADLLKKFHSAIELRCREKGHGVGRIGLLSNQLTAYEAIFKDLTETMKKQINDSQREINREFTPVITAAMEQAYQLCTDESGIGSYKRMKSHMYDHVDSNKLTMFSAACNKVQNSLSGLCEEVRETMLDRADKVFVNMQRDYMSIIGGVNVEKVSMSREERSARRELDETITAVDVSFQRILDADLNDIKGNCPGAGDEEQLENNFEVENQTEGEEYEQSEDEDCVDEDEEDIEEGGLSEAEEDVEAASEGDSGYKET